MAFEYRSLTLRKLAIIGAGQILALERQALPGAACVDGLDAGTLADYA